MAIGAMGFLALGKESTWGTAVVVTDYAELLSESLALTIDRFEIKNIAALYTEADDMAGIRRIAGDVSMPVFPEVLLPVLTGIFGVASVSAAGTMYANKFTTPIADYASGLPTMPFTFEVYRDTTSSFLFSGAVMNSLQFEVAPNQELRATINCIAKSVAVSSKTSPTFVSSPVEPFAFDTCSISIGGTGTALVEALTININNQLEGIPALNATTAVAKIRRTGPQMVTISGTMDFSNLTEFNNFINQTEQAISVHFTRNNSFQMTVDLPRVVYTAFPVSMGGKERMTVSFEGKGRYQTASKTAISVILTTTTSGF